MDMRLQRRHELGEDLRLALLNDDFDLVFQPIFAIHSLDVIGAEVLVRWTNSRLGTISPGVFIPLAEEIGLMPDLGAWIMRHACQTAEKWPAALCNLRLSINLSPVQLTHPDFLAAIDDLFAETTVQPGRITFEITEGVLMNDVDAARDILNALRSRAFRIAVDDFGTGYSSLAYLKTFPIDHLKIDRTFVNDLDNEEDDRAIVRAIIGLANNLRLTVVAEGIETAEQLRRLADEGCEFGQGFLYSPPLANSEFCAFVERKTTGKSRPSRQLTEA